MKAFCFAGQGAQYVGMGQDLDPAVSGPFWAHVDEVLGQSLSVLVDKGPGDTLTLTQNTQPAVLALGTLHAKIVREMGVSPGILLGHSLGEYAAWVAAGSLALDDALGLVRLRGLAMQEAVPVGEGGMSAIISAPVDELEAICEEVAARRGEILQVAIINCPGNTVISGHLGAIEEAERAIEEQRVGVPRRLAVSAPFHCALLEPAARRLEVALRDIPVSPNTLPVIPNVTGEVAAPGQDPDQIRAWLVEQVMSPVRWEASLRTALSLGITEALSLGPGGMVRAHLKRVARKFPLLDMDKPADRAKLEMHKEQTP